MEVSNRVIGLTMNLVMMGHDIANFGIYSLLFLTTWGIIFGSVTLFIGLTFPELVNFRRRAAALTWIQSFMVMFLYWGYLYPLLRETLDFVNFCRHGGLIVFVVIEFLALRQPVHQKAISDILIFEAIYCFGFLIPLGLAGSPIYKNVTFRNLASWIVFFFGVSLVFVGHFILKLIYNMAYRQLEAKKAK